MVLFRPVGCQELFLIQESDYKSFPPRLPIQPIFYPVLNEEYAIQIARDWNTRDEASWHAGYVTQFEVDDDYVSKFDRKIVGAKVHEELWVPAEELAEFNSHILGKIEVIHSFYSMEWIHQHFPGDYHPTSAPISPLAFSVNVFKILQAQAWRFAPNIEQYEYCKICRGLLCSDCRRPNGRDWQTGYKAASADDNRLYLCPPCFTCVKEPLNLQLLGTS